MPNQPDPKNSQPVNLAPTAGNQPAAPSVFPQSDLPPLPDFSAQGGRPADPPVGSASPPDLPPVISTSTKKKFGGGKVIATILGILLLIGGVGAGIFLTQQRQLFQQKAYTGSSGPNTVCGVEISATENPQCVPLCNFDENGDSHCSGKNDIGDTYGTTYTLTNTTAQQHVVNYTKFSYYCPRFPYGDSGLNCMLNEVKQTVSVTLQANQKVNIPVSITGLKFDGNSCGTYQTDFKVNSVDNNHSCQNGLAFAVCRTGRDCQADWTPPPAPTVTPTATPGTQPVGCEVVHAYKADGSGEYSKANLESLAPGTAVLFCVAGIGGGPNYDMARFTINGTDMGETKTHRPGGQPSTSAGTFCQSYTIKPADKKVDVKAQIHHITLGWF